jgi:hypothetical protein
MVYRYAKRRDERDTNETGAPSVLSHLKLHLALALAAQRGRQLAQLLQLGPGSRSASSSLCTVMNSACITSMADCSSCASASCTSSSGTCARALSTRLRRDQRAEFISLYHPHKHHRVSHRHFWRDTGAQHSIYSGSRFDAVTG